MSDEPAQQEDSPVIRDLRKQIKSQADTITTLRSTLRSKTLESLGVPDEARDSVLELLSKTSDEEWGSADTIREALTSKGFGRLLDSDDHQGGGPPPNPVTPAEQRMEAIRQYGVPPSGQQPSIHDRIRAAEEQGDHDTAATLKMDLLVSQALGQPVD